MKKIGILMVLAIAMLSVSVLADGRWGGKDVLEMGIFETKESTLKFPAAQDTNIDLLEVGNDRALAIGRGKDPIATNNLEIKKNQDSGKCGDCCDPYTKTYNTSPGTPVLELESHDCKDCCIKVNVDQIKVGDRNALAFGPGFEAATNNVKIVADQQ
jgi:hypothetical protein